MFGGEIYKPLRQTYLETFNCTRYIVGRTCTIEVTFQLTIIIIVINAKIELN